MTIYHVNIRGCMCGSNTSNKLNGNKGYIVHIMFIIIFNEPKLPNT